MRLNGTTVVIEDEVRLIRQVLAHRQFARWHAIEGPKHRKAADALWRYLTEERGLHLELVPVEGLERYERIRWTEHCTLSYVTWQVGEIVLLPKSAVGGGSFQATNHEPVGRIPLGVARRKSLVVTWKVSPKEFPISLPEPDIAPYLTPVGGPDWLDGHELHLSVTGAPRAVPWLPKEEHRAAESTGQLDGVSIRVEGNST